MCPRPTIFCIFESTLVTFLGNSSHSRTNSPNFPFRRLRRHCKVFVEQFVCHCKSLKCSHTCSFFVKHLLSPPACSIRRLRLGCLIINRSRGHGTHAHHTTFTNVCFFLIFKARALYTYPRGICIFF